MTKLSLLLLCAAAASAGLPATLLAACATDNGDAVHGPQFGPPPERPDSGGADGSLEGDGGGPSPDGSTDAGTDADGAPACTSGTVAVLAGTDATLSGAVQVNGGAWTGAALAGGAAKSTPSLVPFGTGFVALTQGPSNALQSLTYGASWSAVTAVGSLTTLGTPALAVLGANGQAIYLSAGADLNKFSRIQNTGAAWTTTGDPVMPPAGTQSYGPSAGVVAAASTDLVFAQDGDDEGLYVQKWSGAAWTAAAPINGAGTLKTAPPALVSVPGKFDLVLLYADNTVNHVIGFATRDATTKAWSTATVTQATAQTSEAMSAALVSATSIVVTFRGNNGKAYTMTGTLGASAVSWSVPVLLLADGSVTVDSAPAVAKGICGDDAIAVFASGGQVKATQLRGGAWSVPAPVTGASGNRVSVATR